jgi:hypothetical protein
MVVQIASSLRDSVDCIRERLVQRGHVHVAILVRHTRLIEILRERRLFICPTALAHPKDGQL